MYWIAETNAVGLPERRAEHASPPSVRRGRGARPARCAGRNRDRFDVDRAHRLRHRLLKLAGAQEVDGLPPLLQFRPVLGDVVGRIEGDAARDDVAACRRPS
jgi:hypothetical protein